MSLHLHSDPCHSRSRLHRHHHNPWRLSGQLSTEQQQWEHRDAQARRLHGLLRLPAIRPSTTAPMACTSTPGSWPATTRNKLTAMGTYVPRHPSQSQPRWNAPSRRGLTTMWWSRTQKTAGASITATPAPHISSTVRRVFNLVMPRRCASGRRRPTAFLRNRWDCWCFPVFILSAKKIYILSWKLKYIYICRITDYNNAKTSCQFQVLWHTHLKNEIQINCSKNFWMIRCVAISRLRHSQSYAMIYQYEFRTYNVTEFVLFLHFIW